MPNIFGNNNVAPPGVPIPPGPMGPQGPQGPPGPAAIQEEGVSLPARGFLNFVGSGVTAADDAAHNRVTVTVTGGGGGATPGGPTTSIQVNDAGALAGYPALTYDGLTLAGGQLQFTCVNPTTCNDANERRAWDLNVTTDSQNCVPSYPDANAFEIHHTVTGGYYNYDATIQNKTTTFPLYVNLLAQGASQAFAAGLFVQKDGMGDCGAFSGIVTYRGGPVEGDEGQCFQCVTYLRQDHAIVTAPILAVKRSACPASMTVTQTVTSNKDPQTVTVSSTTGLVAGDWLVAGQSRDVGVQHIRAIQVLSFTSTTITAVIPVNMISGDSLKAALVLTIQTGRFGQLLPLVNLSGPTYSTGTVASISNADFHGTGTAWAANVVGGDALNIGAVSLVADNDTEPNGTGSDFDSTPPESGGHMLRSWYQISSVTAAATLTISSFSVAGNRDYRGKGPGTGGYLIKPAARALWFPDSGTAVCEYSAHTWNVGDLVESTMCPYPDVSLQQWNMSAYTPGGSYRGGIVISNNGHRTFGFGLSLHGLSMTGGDKPWAWSAGVSVENCKNGIQVTNPLESGISIYNDDFTRNGNLVWHGDGTGRGEAHIGTYGNQWDSGHLALYGGNGYLNFCTVAFTGEGWPEMRWGGNFTVYPPNGNDLVFLQLAADQGPSGATRNLNGWRIETVPGAIGNLYFRFISYATGDNNRVFSVNTGYGTVFKGPMVPKRGTATVTQNFGSCEYIFENSVWNAGAETIRLSALRTENETDGSGRLAAYIPRASDGQANRAFSVTGQGKLSIGTRMGSFIGDACSVTFDPTGIPDGHQQVITLPDASGTMALTSDVAAISRGPGLISAALPASAGDIVTLGSITPNDGSHLSDTLQIQASVTSGNYNEAGVYQISLHYDATGGTWQILAPVCRHANPGQNDFILEINGAGDTASLRARRANVGTDMPTLRIYIQHFNPGMTWTTSVAASTQAAVTAFYAGSGSIFYTINQPVLDGSGLTAPRTITIPDASGTMVLTPLPSASPGSGKLWYDPADSNRVKYTP